MLLGIASMNSMSSLTACGSVMSSSSVQRTSKQPTVSSDGVHNELSGLVQYSMSTRSKSFHVAGTGNRDRRSWLDAGVAETFAHGLSDISPRGPLPPDGCWSVPSFGPRAHALLVIPPRGLLPSDGCWTVPSFGSRVADRGSHGRASCVLMAELEVDVEREEELSDVAPRTGASPGRLTRR